MRCSQAKWPAHERASITGMVRGVMCRILHELHECSCLPVQWGVGDARYIGISRESNEVVNGPRSGPDTVLATQIQQLCQLPR